MTPDTTNLADRIDADRRKKERELLALLLLLARDAERHAVWAARQGNDPIAAAGRIITGAPQIDQPGLGDELAAILAAAYLDGWHRTELVLPGDSHPIEPDYRQAAYIAAADFASTLQRRIAEAVGVAAGGIGGTVRAIRDALKTWGYLRRGDNGAWHLEAIAVTLAGQAYNSGYLAGFRRPEAADVLYGLQHVSVRDERTSEICWQHDGTKLPADDPFWLNNLPPLHFSCRSFLRPLFAPFTPSDYPDIAPEPGFGRATFAGVLRSVALVAA